MPTSPALPTPPPRHHHRAGPLGVLAALARDVGVAPDEATVRVRVVDAAGELVPGHRIDLLAADAPAPTPTAASAPLRASGPSHGVLVALPDDTEEHVQHGGSEDAADALAAVATVAASALDRLHAEVTERGRRDAERERLERVLVRLRRLRDRDVPRVDPHDVAATAPEPDADTAERVDLLRRAMALDRPTLHGQPLRTLLPDGSVGAVEAVELLLRPHDRDGRPMPPGQVLPALEEQTIAGALDRWVVVEALRWTPDGPGRVAVNLSGRSIGDARFGRWLLSAVASSPLPPHRLRFEIPESAVVSDMARAASLFTELAGMGCELALDDFGAPGGSPHLLTRMPFHVVKLDGDLVAGLRDNGTDIALLRSILDITVALGMRTVAEHVDGPDLLPSLAALGVHAVQGYGIGRPGPLRDQGLHELVQAEAEPAIA